jgi:diguanylate cyclase (GGDEF)-like protein
MKADDGHLERSALPLHFRGARGRRMTAQVPAAEKLGRPAPAVPLGMTSVRHFERITSLALREQPTQLLIVLDVDHFRAFKNVHGPAAGDVLIRTLQRRLDDLACGIGGRLARLGVDEFALLAPSSREIADAASWVKALIEPVALPIPHQGGQLAFSLSTGLAQLPDHGTTIAEGLRCARLAVTAGKQAGGGRVTTCSPGQLAAAQCRDVLARELPGAIAAGELVPFYQPVVALPGGQIAGMEVLARWRHPQHGMLEPASFIHQAEEQGLCCALTRALLAQVRVDARDWPTHWRFAFNTTPNELAAVFGLIDSETGCRDDIVPADRIDIEITETALMRDLEKTREIMAVAAPLGLRIVLDDFGTGYCNFQQLRCMPFSRLKIDKSFITDLLDDYRAEGCARAIIDLAHHLGMTATAEGVENAELMSRLIAMGCDHAQGYHFARPVPACEVNWLTDTLLPRALTGGLEDAA